MALTACRECQREVSSEAPTCPHCGARAPVPKKAGMGVGGWVLVILGCIVGLFVGLAVLGSLLPRSERSQQQDKAF